MFISCRQAVRVEAIRQDFENRTYLVVTLDDDPGREQWDERVLPGHRFYFFPEEVELLEQKYAEMRMGLSEPVQAAIDEGVKMIDSLLERLLALET